MEELVRELKVKRWRITLICTWLHQRIRLIADDAVYALPPATWHFTSVVESFRLNTIPKSRTALELTRKVNWTMCRARPAIWCDWIIVVFAHAGYVNSDAVRD